MTAHDTAFEKAVLQMLRAHRKREHEAAVDARHRGYSEAAADYRSRRHLLDCIISDVRAIGCGEMPEVYK